jgi:hypothetical protein
MITEWIIKKAEGWFFGGDGPIVEFKTPIKIELRDEPYPGYEILAEIEAPETKNPENQIFWGKPGEKIRAIYTVKKVIEPNEIILES